jgi:hypothetical protein
MSESRVRENRTHGSMRRREATPDQSAMPRGPRTPPADPTIRARTRDFRFACSRTWSSSPLGAVRAAETARFSWDR